MSHRPDGKRPFKFSLAFVLVLMLAFAACFAWFRWSRLETQIHEAVAKGDIVTVSRLIKRRPTLFTKNKYHSPSMLLLAAVDTRSANMVSLIAPLMMESVADQKQIWNAFSQAVRNEDLEVVRILLANGWDPNSNPDYSVLQEAKKRNNVPMVELLLQHDADPTKPLAWACEQPDTRFAKRLLSLGADARTPHALANAVRANHQELLHLLLKGGANPATGLTKITDESSRAFVNTLIDDGDFDLDLGVQRTILGNLFTLQDSGILDAVLPKLLATKTGKSLDPLGQLVESSFGALDPVAKMKILLRHGVGTTIGEEYDGPLFDLARVSLFADKEQIELVTLLVEATPTDMFDASSPLAECFGNYGAASRATQFEIAKILLQAGLGNAIDSEGATLLHIACREDRPDEYLLRIVQMLIDDGADVNARDKYGRTPLHKACSSLCFELAELLLLNGADANLASDFGQTPLNWLDLHVGRPAWLPQPTARRNQMKDLLSKQSGGTRGSDDSIEQAGK